MGELNGMLERLAEAESQLAFQDTLNQQLNEVMARQDREIIELKLQLARLAERLLEMQEAWRAPATGAEKEIPPHY